MLSSRAANTVELATVTCLRADLYTALDQSDRAVAVCLEYLRQLGVEWSAHPTEEEARREYERIWSQLGSRAIEQLIELRLMSDPASLATLDVLTKLLPPAWFTDANLGSPAICRAVNLSLEHGNSDGSCFAYVYLGMIAGPYFGNYKVGFRFGRLGYELVEKRGLKRFQAGTYMLFGSHVMPWTQHVRACRDLMHRTFQAAKREFVDAAPSFPFSKAAPKIMFNPGRCLIAFLGRLDEQLHDDCRDSSRDILQPLTRGDWLSCNVAVDPFHRVGSREGKIPGQHFVKCDAKRVEVAPGIDGTIHSSGLLRCHIGECPGDKLGRLGRLALAWKPRSDRTICAVFGAPERPASLQSGGQCENKTPEALLNTLAPQVC
jgi:hypothetical protein